jgi:alpha/beta superfamily hydrolase
MQSLDDTSEFDLPSILGRLSAINGPAGSLEVDFRESADPRAGKVAVICHPHPQHDGTMDNKVVTTLSRTYSKLGWHSLRFNFRGVGQSDGSYGHLKGEIEDLQAIVSFIRTEFPHAVISLAGFSFGSAVAANVAKSEEGIAHLLLIAPPVGKYELEFPENLACPTLVVQGSLDDVVDLARTRDWAKSAKGKITYCELPDAGHFFHGKLTELATTVSKNFSPQLVKF